jgi:hypothetical protein
VHFHLEKRKGILQDTNKKLPVADFQAEIWEALDSDDDVNCIYPRGHAKSTTIIEYMLWA